MARKEDLGLNCLKKDQFGSWLRAGTGNRYTGEKRGIMINHRSTELALVGGSRKEGSVKEWRGQFEGEGEKEGSKGNYEGRKEESRKEDAKTIDI